MSLAHILPAVLALVAQGNVDRGGFVVCLGTDTLAVERYTRIGGDPRERGDSPSPHGPAGELHRRARRPRRGPQLHPRDRSAGARSAGGPAESRRPLVPRRHRGGFAHHGRQHPQPEGGRTAGVHAARGFSHALVEQAIIQARRTGQDSVEFDWVGVGASKAYPAYVARRKDGTVMVGFFDAPALATLDRRGRMLAPRRQSHHGKGRGQTGQGAGSRADSPAPSRPPRRRGGRWGQLSPRDTVWARIGGAHLMVDYGRPSKRGRAIFGDVVPWEPGVAHRGQRGHAVHDRHAARDRGPDDSCRTLQPVDHSHGERRDADRERPDRTVGHRIRSVAATSRGSSCPGRPWRSRWSSSPSRSCRSRAAGCCG